MGFFSFLKSKRQGAFDAPSDREKQKTVEKQLKVYRQTFKKLRTTNDVDEFFNNYARWLDSMYFIKDQISYKDRKKWYREYPEIFEFDSSNVMRSKLQIAFLRRISVLKDDVEIIASLYRYRKYFADGVTEYCENNIGKFPVLPDSGQLIFCSVSFNYSEKTYYYLTDDIKLRVGDEVMVPAGNYNKFSVGTVRKVEYFYPENAPYPLEKIKSIIRKI